MKINKKYTIILLIIIVSIILLIINYSNIFENYENSNTTNELPLPLPYDVVIVGCARDIEAHLPNTKQKLEMVKSLFRSSKIIIYENDSKDKTLELLSTWNNENFIKLITEKDVKGIRTERLAYARNLLYKEAMKHNFDLLIVIDLDNVIDNLTPESILNCFNKELIDDWAMLGANQIGNYYDMFALRTFDDWMPFDFEKCLKIEKKTKAYCLDDRYKNIPKDDKPIQVKSCFGGTAIYKKKYLNNCDYGKGFQMNGNEKIEFCEHVDFNEGVIKNGGKIYINPKFINH
jgi:hypothetical protein